MPKKTIYIKVKKTKKHGLQAKTKMSKSKTSKNYKKQYRGQGR
jgi:hypothetical protein